MLKTVVNSENKTTIAIIKGCETDAFNHISKRFSLEDFCNISHNLIIKNKYTGTVRCNEADTYDENVGIDEAVKKAMANHNRGFKKAIIKWQVAMLKKLKEVDEESFNIALEKIK